LLIWPSPLNWLLGFGLLLGLMCVFKGSSVGLGPVEALRLDLADMPSRIARTIRTKLIFWLCVSLLLGLAWGLTEGWSSLLVGALMLGLMFVLIGELLRSLIVEAVETRISPNQGTRYSMRTALGALLIVGRTISVALVLRPASTTGVSSGWAAVRAV
jgi:hypothetical protein